MHLEIEYLDLESSSMFKMFLSHEWVPKFRTPEYTRRARRTWCPTCNFSLRRILRLNWLMRILESLRIQWKKKHKRAMRCASWYQLEPPLKHTYTRLPNMQTHIHRGTAQMYRKKLKMNTKIVQVSHFYLSFLPFYLLYVPFKSCMLIPPHSFSCLLASAFQSCTPSTK